MNEKKIFCSICWESFDTIHTLKPCGHLFCKYCITKQLKYDARCAMCRQYIFSCDPYIIPFDDIYKTITIDENINKKPLGIELIKENEIIKIRRAKKNKSEFRINQQIISVNGLPILNPKCFTQILQCDNIKPFECQIINYNRKTNILERIRHIVHLCKTSRH